MPSFILGICGSRPTRRQIARALHSGGMDLEFAEPSQPPEKAFVGRTPSLVVLDADTSDAQVVDALLAHVNAAGNIPVVVLSVGANKTPLLDLLKRHGIGNLVAKHGAIRAVYPVLDERELLVTCQKVLRRDVFGLEKYVGSWGVRMHHDRVRALADKGRILAEFETFLGNLDCPATIIPEIATVAEELILNAVVHAPRDASGRPKYEDRGPDPSLVLEPAEFVDVAYACDGQRLMVSVTDRFGTLNRDTVYNYIAKGLAPGKMDVEHKPGGAGLGLSLAFSGIHQLIFNVREGVRTEAIAGWYLRVNTALEFRQVEKSLNLFWLPEDSKPLEEEEPMPSKSVPSPSNTQTASIRGRIDETTDLNRYTRANVLDLREVTGFTSRGVLKWVNFVSAAHKRGLAIVGCPPALARLAHEVQGVLTGVVVKSVIAPYECSGCTQEENIELSPAEAVKATPRTCPKCGGQMGFVGMEQHYEAVVSSSAK